MAAPGRQQALQLLKRLSAAGEQRALLFQQQMQQQMQQQACSGVHQLPRLQLTQPLGSRALGGRRHMLAPISSWRAWMGQQLAAGSSPCTAHNAGRRLLHATAAARLPAAPAAAAGRWWDTWVMWVDRRSAALLMASLLNSLNSVGHKLPVALGLMLVDMAHSSPLLGGSRADAWEPQVLPASLPAGGFYATGGPAAAALAAADAACGGGSSSAASGGGARARAAAAWSELGAALSASARLLWLGCIWLPALVTAPLVHGSARWRAWWLALMTLSLEASGPAFIKWGQWAATRHDLFAHDVCSALERLHTQAPAHSFRYTCLALQRSFALPTSELFTWIEEVPIACGSIGQVHRAMLSEKGAALTGCEAGDTVAVKVRHPGVSEAIERDFQTMVWLAHVATNCVPSLRSLRLDDTLKQFAAPLHEQVDLSREAANLQRFNTNFRRARGVSFPLPLYPLVSPDVLVESFEAGTHISAYISAKQGSHPYRIRLAELGSGTMLQMMLVDNLIHSDLHPGNILVRLEQPHGLVGVAYKAITALANPEGLPMKALASALDRLSNAARQGPDSSSGGGGGSSSVAGAAAGAGAAAVSQQQPQQQLQAVSSSTKARAWLSQMRSAWATGGPSALLSTLQAQLSSVAAAWLQPHIVLLDVGMATELSPEDQHNMVGLFRAFAALDGRDVARWTLAFSGDEQACEDPQSFISDMETTFEALKKTIAAHAEEQELWQAQQQQQQRLRGNAAATPAAAAATLPAVADNDSSSSSSSLSSTLIEMPDQFDSGSEALATVLELVRAHQVSLPGHVAGCVVTTLILEGWSNRLAPEHSVLHQVQEMFSPALLPWGDRITKVVDVVMDNDNALAMA